MSAELHKKAMAAVQRLNQAAEAHGSDQVWALFSGGTDSLACALVTSQARQFRGCLHIDTGTGIPETQEYVRTTCKRMGWPLRIVRAQDLNDPSVEGRVTDYRLLVLQRGFPGPGMHRKMYGRLKERPLDAFLRDIKAHRYHRIIWSTGARSEESVRRMSTTHAAPQRDGCNVWVNALHDWTKLETRQYARMLNVPSNEVCDLIHMSGECLCGAFAREGELDELALWFPKVAARIRALEKEVKRAGHKYGWGERSVISRRKGLKVKNHIASPLCSGCSVKASAKTAETPDSRAPARRACRAG